MCRDDVFLNMFKRLSYFGIVLFNSPVTSKSAGSCGIQAMKHPQVFSCARALTKLEKP